MDDTILVYQIILMLFALMSFIASVVTIRKNCMTDSKIFAVAFFLIGFWLSSYAVTFKFYEYNPSELLKYSPCIFTGVVFIPVLWLLFALEYTGKGRYFANGRWCLLTIIPILTLAAAFTNYNHLFYLETPAVDSTGITYTLIEYGISYNIHCLYSYALLMAGLLIFIIYYFESPVYYRSRIVLIIFAVLIPMTGNFVSVGGFLPSLNFDITPFFFFISMSAMYLAAFYYPKTEIMPYTKDTIISLITDGVIMTDNNYNIIEVNPAAEKYIAASNGFPGGYSEYTSEKLAGRNLSEVFKCIIPHLEELRIHQKDEGEFVLIAPCGDDASRYHAAVTSTHSMNEQDSAKLIILEDFTENYRVEQAILKSKKHYDMLFNNISDGIILHDVIPSGWGKIYTVNDTIVNITGYTKEEFIQMGNSDINKEVGTSYDKYSLLEALKRQKSISYKITFRSKDGRYLPLQITTSRLSINNEERYISLIHDITKETQARELEFKTLSQISSNINYLTKTSGRINTHLESIRKICSGPHKCSKSSIILEQADVISGIVNDLDRKCLESEKIHSFLAKHYNFEKETSNKE